MRLRTGNRRRERRRFWSRFERVIRVNSYSNAGWNEVDSLNIPPDRYLTIFRNRGGWVACVER